ncbi:MAG: hypothetical protein KGL63_11040, partial [Betaproteobacteria bacterium]|nr:hypothetical protein [Betaproteobacteria bacterium]
AHRLTREPPAWRAWVQDQAERGDKAAQVEMRRWQAPEPGKAGERGQVQTSQPGRYGELTDGVEMRARSFRGGVEYRINGKVAVIESKGNVIRTVDKGREPPQAIALAVSLQAAKRGGHVKIDGNRAYKDRVADIAATRGLSVKFEDRRMQARYAGRLAQVRPGMTPPKPQSSLLKGGWFAHLLTPAPLQPSQLPALQPDLKPTPITPGQLTALRAREQQRIEQERSR